MSRSDRFDDAWAYYWTRGESPSVKIDVKPMTTYYWRVAAFNDVTVSSFSTTATFQTGNRDTLITATGTFDDGSAFDDYENNRDIYWLIKPTNALPSTKITLSFLSFETESDYDSVTLYDGETTSARVIDRFSGTSLPPSCTSSGPVMLVRFTSDAFETAHGWTAKYESNFWVPTFQEISDYAEQLSVTYKIPSVVIKAILEQETDSWNQFLADGSPNINPKDGGIGLMQVTPNKVFDDEDLICPGAEDKAWLGWIDESNPQPDCSKKYGFESQNGFTTRLECVKINRELLKWDWRYNLEVGVRWLLTKKVSSKGECDDAGILENWYYPVAYYNGARPGGLNDPSQSFSRQVQGSNWKDPSVFPYQERIYNILAQNYPIDEDRIKFLGPPRKVTLPGPMEVKSGDGRFDYVQGGEEFCFYDWATYFRDGTVWIGKCGESVGCIPCKKDAKAIGHSAPFGPPGITVTQTVSGAGLVNFSTSGNQTGVAIDFKSVTGSGSALQTSWPALQPVLSASLEVHRRMSVNTIG